MLVLGRVFRRKCQNQQLFWKIYRNTNVCLWPTEVMKRMPFQGVFRRRVAGWIAFAWPSQYWHRNWTLLAIVSQSWRKIWVFGNANAYKCDQRAIHVMVRSSKRQARMDTDNADNVKSVVLPLDDLGGKETTNHVWKQNAQNRFWNQESERYTFCDTDSWSTKGPRTYNDSTRISSIPSN